MTHGSRTAVLSLALRHLTPPADAEKCLRLLRPRIHGDAPSGSAGVVRRLDLAALSGLPALPALSAESEWPGWERHGPLSLVASIDCGLLPRGALDIDLPDTGTRPMFTWQCG